MKICKVCHAYMIDHDELLFWKKCPTCGYCEQVDVTELSPSMQNIMSINVLAPRNFAMAVKPQSYKKED